jgi:hypothetical protein
MTCSLGLYKKRWVTTVAARPAVWAYFRKYFRRCIDFRKTLLPASLGAFSIAIATAAERLFVHQAGC